MLLTLLVVLVISIIDVFPSQSISCTPPYSIQPVTAIYTIGNAGFEYFNINNNHFLATANFWDGKSQDMSALSPIYQLQQPISLQNLSISATVFQEFKSKGAHGVDYFEFGDSSEHKFLVIPSYYGCERSHKEVRNAPECMSTVIYRFDENKNRFDEFQKLSTGGPSQTDHFIHNNKLYIAIAENFINEISIYKFRYFSAEQKWQFHRVQVLPCAGVAGVAAAVLSDNSVVLVGASYHDRGWKTRSPVFLKRSDSKDSLFHLIQELDSHGAHDIEMMQFHDSELYMAISEDRSDKSSEIQSHIYKLRWIESTVEAAVTTYGDVSIETRADSTTTTPMFELVQAIPTNGAHASEFFILDDTLLLAVANFGNRHLKRIDAMSSVWALTENGSFELVFEVPTRGATDWEYFEMNGQSYLAVSNEGEIKTGEDMSFVYKITKNSE